MKRREFVHGMAGAAAALGAPSWRQGGAPAGGRSVARLDTGWKFLRDDPAGAESPGLDDAAWQPATLPHTARIEALVTGPADSPEAQWQGICWYRRTLRLPPDAAGRSVLLKFEGAMNVADVWLDGRRIGAHLGGYLPFVLDLSDGLTPGQDHLLAVRLDNRDNPITGPKPLAQLDFNMYHGLYRPASPDRQGPAPHHRSPAGRPAGGRRRLRHLPQRFARSRRGAGADPRIQRRTRRRGASGCAPRCGPLMVMWSAPSSPRR